MPRRQLLTAATLSLLTLTACTPSPKAGRPNTTPTTHTSTPAPIPTATVSDPIWTPEQEAAITAAKTRYVAATAAVDKALGAPAALDRSALEKSGVGGEWIIEIIDQARSFTRSGWYQTGATRIVSTKVKSVKLDGGQPEVNLINCLDTSALVTRFEKDHKPVPMGPGTGKRRLFTSRLVYAAPAPSGQKLWFLVADQGGGKC
ncbi:hypothetical protein [Kribbella solani]|uniref:Lipoprotein n=1 Tax=Kribbella solani TaxID=236067 RepID=A0A841DLG4_9ACTN|nr:hypothetical protein [Kribbella solani]MBB5979493.1 hypothetical protein [Kribbella solani]